MKSLYSLLKRANRTPGPIYRGPEVYAATNFRPLSLDTTTEMFALADLGEADRIEWLIVKNLGPGNVGLVLAEGEDLEVTLDPAGSPGAILGWPLQAGEVEHFTVPRSLDKFWATSDSSATLWVRVGG